MIQRHLISHAGFDPAPGVAAVTMVAAADFDALASENAALKARVVEAERLLNDVVTPWPSGRCMDGGVIVSAGIVQEIRAFQRPAPSADEVNRCDSPGAGGAGTTLLDFGYAPGNYTNVCIDCLRQHTADKRASRCVNCARQRLDATPAASHTPGDRND